MASSGPPKNQQRRFVKRKPAPPKPLSAQKKREVTKTTITDMASLPFAPLPHSEKAELPPGDVRLHVPTQELNKLYYTAAKTLASGKGRATFKAGDTLGTGTVTFRVKLSLKSDSCYKMTGGVLNSNPSSVDSQSIREVSKLLKELVLKNSEPDEEEEH